MKARLTARVIRTLLFACLLLALSTSTIFASNEWKAVADAPGHFDMCSALAVLDDYIYALRGTVSQDFWRYDPIADVWKVLAPMPEVTNLYGGITLCATDKHIYAIPGGYRPNFWCYDPQTDSWTKKARTAWWASLEWGTSIVWTKGDFIYLHSRDVGLVQYNFSTDSWSKVADSPFPTWTGSTLVWTGGDDLYLNQGWASPSPEVGRGFARYSFSTGSWTTLTSSPKMIFAGMVWTQDDYIYARPAYDTDDFYRYLISEDKWEMVSKMPQPINPLTDFAPDFDLVFWKGCIYTAGGQDNAKFWSFCVGTPATIDINPNALNLKSKGWITVYIELPECYNVEDIDVSTILLNDTIPIDSEAPTQIGDYDSDGIPDLMVKFSRTEVLESISNAGLPSGRFGQVTLEVTGELSDETSFEGSDTIRVIGE